MKADFSGYATKANLLCSDGRTIMPDAFKGQDKVKVPLVWQHSHTDPENVLGHAILENRTDGVYAHAYFNKSKKAQHAQEMVEHGDVNGLSIWANELIERSKKVLHGKIKEVSLVLSGANPGALIDNITMRHGDVDELLEDEAIIHTGLGLEFDTEDDANLDDKNLDDPNLDDKNLGHAADDPTIQEVIDSMNDNQKNVVAFLVARAAEDAAVSIDNTAAHGDLDKEGTEMRTNVFEQGKVEVRERIHLSHSDFEALVAKGKNMGSLRAAVLDWAESNSGPTGVLKHGIDDIDLLFPDAKSVSDSPEWNKRRTEWVDALLSSVSKSPFARIKTLSADITMESARAKGYITGNMKKEEFFGLARRITTPQTIYKKQALDRDDMIDITDFDVVAWLKGEMRLMLDEELARAILIGDGRDISDEDKIQEANIRPIATDNEIYTTRVNVNVSDANSDMTEVTDAIIANRYKYKGSGQPIFYTTEYWIAKFLLMRDGDGRRMYKNLDEIAAELRVSSIVAVEAMQESPEFIGIMVNPVDYRVGADKGGEVNMFDDFDIDYNKQKYLIETRVSGALTKLKSAMVIVNVNAGDVLIVPTEPTYDPSNGHLTINDTAHVVYKNGAGTTLTNGSSPYTVTAGTEYTVLATPASGYYFATSDDDSWTYRRPSA